MDSFDLSSLSKEEYEKILGVMRRDQMLRKQEEQRILNMKADLQRLRKMGTVRPGVDQNRVCGRCQSELGRFVNRGSVCPVCRKKVCKNCLYSVEGQNHEENVGKDSRICMVCCKQIQFKAVSGEWMKELTRSASEKLRSPSANVIAAATENLSRSLKYSFKPGASESRAQNLFNPIQNAYVIRSFTEPNKDQGEQQVCDPPPPAPPTPPTPGSHSRPLYRSRRAAPLRLPQTDCNNVPKSPQSDEGGSQESSPKPPLSPALKVCQVAYDLVNQDNKDGSRSALISVPNDRKTVYRKVSNRLLDSSSSEKSEDEEEDMPRANCNSRTSSESTPSPRTPNSYKILSGIANNQATAFRFPPLSPVPSRSPLFDSSDRLSSRGMASERQSSDEYSTTMSSFRSRSTSSETNEEFSTGTGGCNLSTGFYGLRNRRASPLRKQRAIAEEASDARSSPASANEASSESLSRYTTNSEVGARDYSGMDSGVESGVFQRFSSNPVASNRITLNGSEGSIKGQANPLKPFVDANNSVNSEQRASNGQAGDVADSHEEATVESTTGVIFRKVTLKKRLDRSQSSRTVRSDPESRRVDLRANSEDPREEVATGREFMSHKSHSADEKAARCTFQRDRVLKSESGPDSASPVPHISVSDYSESFSHKDSVGSSAEEIFLSSQEDDIDKAFAYHCQSSSSYGRRSESLTSLYSAAGGGRYGNVTVSGEILFSLSYCLYKEKLNVYIKECRDLAPVDVKRNRSDPYVKLYLLPDRTKQGKRKTKVKRHTLNPNFDELLTFPLSQSDLESRTLWLSVWHSDTFGRNDFLGEVNLPLSSNFFSNHDLRWYPLQERMDAVDHISFKGELSIALKFVPSSSPISSPYSSIASGSPETIGKLVVLVREAHNLTPTRLNGTSDPFCKSYLLPDKRQKQKTSVVKKTCNPKWNHTFQYEHVSIEQLKTRCLELTVWDHDKSTSNDFLGGLRLGLGKGMVAGKNADWMDLSSEEISLWKQMLKKSNKWVEGRLRLRPTLESRHENNSISR